jgi:hypothetical protein
MLIMRSALPRDVLSNLLQGRTNGTARSAAQTPTARTRLIEVIFTFEIGCMIGRCTRDQWQRCFKVSRSPVPQHRMRSDVLGTQERCFSAVQVAVGNGFACSGRAAGRPVAHNHHGVRSISRRIRRSTVDPPSSAPLARAPSPFFPTGRPPGADRVITVFASFS